MCICVSSVACVCHHVTLPVSPVTEDTLRSQSIGLAQASQFLCLTLLSLRNGVFPPLPASFHFLLSLHIVIGCDPAHTGCGTSPVDLQGVYSIPALNPVLAWLTCLADQTAIFVPDGETRSFQYPGIYTAAVLSQPPLCSKKHLCLFPGPLLQGALDLAF